MTAGVLIASSSNSAKATADDEDVVGGRCILSTLGRPLDRVLSGECVARISGSPCPLRVESAFADGEAAVDAGRADGVPFVSDGAFAIL